MTTFRIVFALLRIPQFLASLLLFPLVISVVVVYVQLTATSVYTTAINRNAEVQQQHFAAFEDNNIVRRLIYGSGKPRPPIRICRWQTTEVDGALAEIPPSGACSPDRLDVALHVAQPETYQPDDYVRIFDGNIERLHLCTACHPDIIISPESDPIIAEIRSVWAYGLFLISKIDPNLYRRQIAITQEREGLFEALGITMLSLSGFREPVTLSGFQHAIVLILNVALLVVVGLWLALRSHRKVLDYFARNGALLPMVSACGKSSFYSALWLITLLRVGAFLLTAVPLSIAFFVNHFRDEQLENLMGPQGLEFVLWILALTASLSLAAVTASIAELKHRQHLLNILLKYVPTALAFLGAAFWGLSLLLEGAFIQFVRDTIATLPVIGMVPIILAPVFKPHLNVLALHTIIAAGVIVLVLKSNARWFAAHLEEL